MKKIVAFDLFGTLVDFKNVPYEERKSYADQIKDWRAGHLKWHHAVRIPVWKPLELPQSWEHLKAYPDVKEGLKLLNENFIVTTCSNAPVDLTLKIIKNNKLYSEGKTYLDVLSLADHKVYKPWLGAYAAICEKYKVPFSEVVMVSANKDFGDIESANYLGMQGVLIRDESSPIKDLFDLNDYLLGI